MARATSDITTVRSLVGFGAISTVSTALAFVGALAAMLAVDPWLTLWAMAPSPALVLLARRYNGTVTERSHATQERLGDLSTLVQERLAGMAVVRAYTMEARATAEFAAANASLRDAAVALAKTQAHFVPLMGLIGGVGTLVIIWVGGAEVASGRLTLGALVAFTGYLAYLAWPTAALGLTLAMLRRGLASMERIQQVLAEARPAPIDDQDRGEPPLAASSGFAGLTFAYEGRSRCCGRDVRRAPGRDGRRRGTNRQWQVHARPAAGPPLGAARRHGVRRRARRHDAVPAPASALSWVPQDAFLFSRSLADNVMLGRASITPHDVRAAAVAAGIDAEVTGSHQGWDTVVGERGLTPPAASVSAWQWPGRWRAGLRSWCSTTSSPTSTRPRKSRCSPSCAAPHRRCWS
jgi:ATP-binding cassette subfamily B protein